MAISMIVKQKLDLMYAKMAGKITQRELEQANAALVSEQLSLGIGAATEVRR